MIGFFQYFYESVSEIYQYLSSLSNKIIGMIFIGILIFICLILIILFLGGIFKIYKKEKLIGLFYLICSCIALYLILNIVYHINGRMCEDYAYSEDLMNKNCSSNVKKLHESGNKYKKIEKNDQIDQKNDQQEIKIQKKEDKNYVEEKVDVEQQLSFEYSKIENLLLEKIQKEYVNIYVNMNSQKFYDEFMKVKEDVQNLMYVLQKFGGIYDDDGTIMTSFSCFLKKSNGTIYYQEPIKECNDFISYLELRGYNTGISEYGNDKSLDEWGKIFGDKINRELIY